MTNLTSIVVKVDSTDVKKASDNFNQFGRDGKKAERDINRFGNQASKTAKQTKQLSSAAQTLTRVLGAVGIGLSVRAIQQFAQESLRAAQNIERQARSLGVTAAEFQRLEFTFRQFGGDSSDLSDAFATLADRAQDAKDGMQSFIDDFKLVGIEVDELRRKDPQQLFRLFAEGVASVDDPTRRLTAVVRILGDDLGNRIAPLLQDGAAGIDEFGSQASVLSTQLIKDSSRIQKEMAMITSQINTELQGAMLGFLVANEEAIIGLTKALRDMMRFVAENERLFQALAAAASAITVIKLAQWAIAAATGIRGLAGAFALITGPGAAIFVLAGVLGTIANEMEKTRQATDEFAQSLNSLTLTQLENELQRLLARQREIMQMTDQMNMFSGTNADIENERARNAREIRELKEAIDNYKVSADDATESTKQLAVSLGISTQEAQNVGKAFAASLPAIDKLPPSVRDLNNAVSGTGEVSRKAKDDLGDLGDSGSDAAAKIGDDFNRVAGQIEGAFANAFERVLAEGLSGFQGLANDIAGIFRRDIAQTLSGSLTDAVGTISGGQLGAAPSLPVTQGARNVEGQAGATVQVPLGAQFTASGAESFALSAEGQAAGLSAPKPQQTPSGAGTGQQLTSSGKQFVAQGNAAQSAAITGGSAMLGTAIGGGGPAASTGATLGATVGMAVGGPVGAVVGSVIGGLFGGSSDRRRLDREQKQRIENMIDELELTIENNKALSESEREMMRNERRMEELSTARNEENRELIETKQALEDRVRELERVNRVNDERISLERRYAAAIGDTARLRQLELDATEAANRGILRFIFRVEDQIQAVASAEQNARSAFQILQEAVESERRELDRLIGEPLEMVASALDRLNQSSTRATTRLDRERAFDTLRQAQEFGLGSVPKEELDRSLRIVSEPSEQLFGSFVEYQRDFERARALLTDIESTSRTQYNEEVKRLDKIIEDGQAQLNALFGIETAVMTVEQAIGNLASSIRAAESARSQLSQIQANPPSFSPAQEQAPPPAPAPQEDIGLLQRAGAYAASRPVGTPEALSIGFGQQSLLRNAGFSVSAMYSFGAKRSELQSLRDRIEAAGGVPEFADGGVHTGGMRIVGERGPELEATGPSRIMSHEDMMSGLRGDNMVAELRSLKDEVAALRDDQSRSQFQIVKNTKRTRDTLEKFDIDGLPPERTYHDYY